MIVVGHIAYQGVGLTDGQVKTFKLSVSAACRKMTADQILDTADLLHEIIRKRSPCCSTAKPSAYDPCVDAITMAGGLSQ